MGRDLPPHRRLAEASAFIFAVIVLNAITLGLGTYDFRPEVESPLNALDEVFLGTFVVELAIRITAYGRRPQDFFKEGWNVLDFVVIALAFAPALRDALDHPPRPAHRPAHVHLRDGGLDPLPRAGSGPVGLHRPVAPEPAPDPHAGELAAVPRARAGQEIHPASWIFFVSSVLIASLLVINVLIAIIINSMEDVHDAEGEEERRRHDELAAGDGTIAERLEEVRRSLDRLEAQLAEGGGDLPAPAR